MSNTVTKETDVNLETPGPKLVPPRPSRRKWLKLAILLAVVLGILLVEIRLRQKHDANLRTVNAQMAVTSVSVVRPKRAAPVEKIILPGNIQPFISSPIYARTDGYLKKWYFDIGAHVRAGQLLATIQAPEVDEQLSQSRSTLATAQANLKLAQITMDRYQGLLQKHAVSQQDVDNAVGSYAANKAIVDADMANVRHYEALVSYENVYAPFEGVVTNRNTDIGDLINAGSNTAPRTDMFHIAQTDTLRVYVNVPEEYWRGIQPGKTVADIVLAEFPDQKFPGKVVRTAEAINGITRTLLTEIDIPNPSNTLLSGSYAEVHLHVPAETPTFLIPSNTLIFRSQHLQVGVVQNGQVQIKDITTGHDLGSEMEVVAGLKADDLVIVNPSDSLVSGQQVNIVHVSLPGDSQ